MQALKHFLEYKAYNLRVSSVIETTMAGSGHVTSALSAADLVAALFFYGMHFDPSDPKNPNNDRFILSKGHACPVLYAVWKELGILTEQDLQTYRTFDSILEGHPTPRFSRSEAATGSLGNGLGIGLGMALAAKLDNLTYRTWVMIGDSESTEGSIWEAAEIAARYKTDNLIAIMDCNRLGQSTVTIHEHHVHRYEEKFKAFGWEVITVDGHDMIQIISALDKVNKGHEGHPRPTMIIAKTFKGHGIDAVENQEGFHGKPFKKEEMNGVLANLQKRFPGAHEYKHGYDWKTQLPEPLKPGKPMCETIALAAPPYKMGELVATRQAYGHALRESGAACSSVVSLDAEVKNSTYAEIFEAKYPERFFQCFVAEQNMVNMGVGFIARGKIPFVSTFGCFFSRAYDQVRMAAIGKDALRLSGSHAGVSIGEDGPSQMALEDIALMRALPESVVLYPSDAVSTYRLVEQMANYTQGISYLRTTRCATQVIYPVTEQFPIGGCKVLRQGNADKVCVVAAGITVFEALKAYDELNKQGIMISVIDLYCVKPIDQLTLINTAKLSGSKIITVEDHYLEGGLGQAVAYELCNTDIKIECLAVTKLPRSGKPAELMAFEEIDAAAIVKKVKEIVK